MNLNFTEEFVIFGVKQHMFTDRIFDLIILNAKYFIFVNKCKESRPTLDGFKNILKLIFQIEKGSCANVNQTAAFEQNWYQYRNLIQ